MNSQRRQRSNAAHRVEDLEGRVTPSALGSFGAWQTMMRTAAVSPTPIQRAAPPSPFQYAQSPAGNLGPGVVATPGISQTAVARFPGYLVSRLNPTPQPTLDVNNGPQVVPSAGHIAMRTNPPNSPNTPVTPATPTTPPNSNEAPPTAPLPANVSGALNTLYQNYSSFVVEHPGGAYNPPPSLGIPVSNNQVGVSVNGNGQGDFTAFVGSLQDLGMNVSSTNSTTWTVSGMLPISELPEVANNSQTLSVVPRYAPVTFGGPMRF